jgi:hypothetical protein
MRKNQTYRETKLTLLHKLKGLRMVSEYFNSVTDERDWFKGYHVYCSKKEVTDRLMSGKPLSCFLTTMATTGDVQEVHVAFLHGEDHRDNTISYLTIEYNTSLLYQQECGVQFCRFACKQDPDNHAVVTHTPRADLQIVNYALMLPYHKRAYTFRRQFTLVYEDWEVLRCSDRVKKGRAAVDQQVFSSILT